jgi:hypothetical protein
MTGDIPCLIEHLDAETAAARRSVCAGDFLSAQLALRRALGAADELADAQKALGPMFAVQLRKATDAALHARRRAA